MEYSARSPLLKKIWLVVIDAIGHLNDDDGWAMASHVALSTLMALFPFIIFVAALAGFIDDAALAGSVADILFIIWPKEVAGPIAGEVHRVLTGASPGLLTLSAAIAIFLASNGVEAVRTALNRAYRSGETRSFIFRRAQSLFFVVIGAVASLTLAFLAVLGPAAITWLAEFAPALVPYAASIDLARFAVTSTLLIVVLVSAHLWLPNNRPPTAGRQAVAGDCRDVGAVGDRRPDICALSRSIRPLHGDICRTGERRHSDLLSLYDRIDHDFRGRVQRRSRSASRWQAPLIGSTNLKRRGVFLQSALAIYGKSGQ